MAQWTWWRREPSDPVAKQLRDLERQGAGMAGLAHLAAFALVIVFSAGSLVALSGDALTQLIARAQAGALDVPAAISIAVSTLLVIAMDTALVYAAASVRLLRLRRASGTGWHVAVIVGITGVEAATYLYMSVIYDDPRSWVVWALIAARAISAPLVAVYLSLARTLPVSARDIIASVELATGRGVVRDMIIIAADPSAPLERKLALYRDASVMTPADSTRLSALIATERTTRAQATPADNEASAPIEASRRLLVPTQGGQDCAPAAQPNMSIISDGHRLLPTSGRNPIVASKLGHSQVAAGDNVTPLRREMGRPTRQDRRTVSRANARSGKRGGAEARVRAVIANDPAAGFDDIVRRAKVSASSASKWLAVVQAEQTAQRQAAQRGTPNGY